MINDNAGQQKSTQCTEVYMFCFNIKIYDKSVDKKKIYLQWKYASVYNEETRDTESNSFRKFYKDLCHEYTHIYIH